MLRSKLTRKLITVRRYNWWDMNLKMGIDLIWVRIDLNGEISREDH